MGRSPRAVTTGWSTTSTCLLLLSLVAAGITIFVCAYTPLLFLVDAAGDDGLFITLGMHIVNGDWLGPFNMFTLAKGPGYPLFLAASHFTGLPVTITQALFLILSVALFSYMVAKVARSPAVGFVLFISTVLHPSFLMERILRDAIYTAQVFLIFGLLIAAFYVFRRWALFWGAAAGLASAWFWLTREEGIWIVPAVVLLIGFAAVRDWRMFRQWRQPTLGVLGFVLLFAAGHAALNTANWAAYGRFQGVDIKEANFVSAYNAIQSVADGDQIPFVPVSKSTRRLIYEVSPTFALMKSSLDPADGRQVGGGCKWYPWTCGDIAGGWLLFSVKATAANLGAYETPDTASAFFGKMAGEIVAACDDGRLNCSPNAIPFMPRITIDQLLNLPMKLTEAVSFLIDYPKWNLSAASTGTPQQVADATAFLNDPMTVKTAPSTAAAVASTIRSWLAPLYAWAMTVLLPLSLVAILAAAALSWRRNADMTLISVAGGLWLLLLARLGLIATIEISSFPAISKWYLSPALYLSVTAPVLSIWCLVGLLRDLRRPS